MAVLGGKMNYSEAVKYIEKDCPSGSKYGLERVKELIRRLDHPENKMRLIHVAGTNGKGSVSRMLQSVLSCEGYKVGIFNSPFLSEPTEYLCIDGKDASQKDYSDMADIIRNAVDGISPMEDKPTEFEMSFAMAMKYFEINHCDFAVIECGLGGLTDATNCIPAPELAIITNIGLDHVRLLGDTVEKITEQKCGIIKTGCSVVSYRSEKKVLDIIASFCKDKKCPLAVADSIPDSDIRSFYSDISLAGEFQKRNCDVVIKAVECLRSRGTAISDASVKKGLSSVKWPARFEIIGKDPLIILDGGHNEQCVTALCESLEKKCLHKAIFVIGVMADKNYQLMFEKLRRFAGYVITTEPDNPRRLPAEASSDLWRQLGVESEAVVSPAAALNTAIARYDRFAGNYDAVIVTGSLYMMGEIRKSIQ